MYTLSTNYSDFTLRNFQNFQPYPYTVQQPNGAGTSGKPKPSDRSPVLSRQELQRLILDMVG